MHNDIKHLETKQRFELIIDDLTCYIDYELSNNVMEITHTVVPKELGGQGLAGKITAFALDTAQANSWQVKPSCSYALAYINKNSKYQNLLA